MPLRKLNLLLVVGLMLGLLVACGGEKTAPVSNTGSAVQTSVASTTLAASSKAGAGATPQTGATPLPVRADPPRDPCTLFSKDDFKAVFGQEADNPTEDPGAKCGFSSVSLPKPSKGTSELPTVCPKFPCEDDTPTTYSLEIQVLEDSISKQSFDTTSIYQDMLHGGQDVPGLGDVAFFESNGFAPTGLYVLKGQTFFALYLLQPDSVTNDQTLVWLKSAAQKLLAHL